jgi:hypothetical protein
VIRLFRVRQRIVRDDRLQMAVSWTTIVALAGVFYLVIVGLWPAAAVLGGVCACLAWLGGAWLRPWGTERYLEQVTGAWERWDERTREADDLLASARELLAQPAFANDLASDHDRLVEQLVAFSRIANDADDETRRERTLLAVEEWRRIRTASERLLDRASREGHQSSAATLRERFIAYEVARSAAHTAASTATEDMILALEKVRAPRAVTSEHSALTEAMKQYRARLESWPHEVEVTGDADALVDEMFETQARVMRAAESINERLQRHLLSKATADDGGS